MGITIRFLILSLSLFLFTVPSMATVPVMRYPSGTPVQVCQASDSNTSCGGSGSGSIQSGTVNIVPVYVGTNTLGPSSNVYIVNSNVGIGTSTPRSVTDIVGDVPSNLGQLNILSSTNKQASIALIPRNDPTKGFLMGMDYGNGGTTRNFFIHDKTNSALRFMIEPGGNVGLGGDDTPDAVLEVPKVGSIPPFMVSSSSAGNGDYLIVLSSGKVGIGYTAPASLLTVGGGVSIGVAAAYVDTVSSSGLIVQGNTGIGTTTPASLFEVGTRKFNVLSGGNVGVGSISPGATLDVQGNIRASSTILASNFSGSSSGTNTGDQSLTSAGGWTDGGTNVFLTTTSDSVGIGTTTPRMPLHYKVGSSLINSAISTYYETSHFPAIFEGDDTHRTYLSIVDKLDNTQNDALLDMKEVNPSSTNEFDDWVIGRTGYTGNFRIGYTANQPNPHVAISAPFLSIDPLGDVGVGTINPDSQVHVYKFIQDVTPPNPNSLQEFGGGNFFTGDTVEYQYYSFKTYNGTTYYSLLFATNSIVISADGDYVFLNWEGSVNPVDGYRILRNYNGAGFIEYQDTPSTSLSDFNDGAFTSGSTVTPTGPIAINTRLNYTPDAGTTYYGLHTSVQGYFGGNVGIAKTPTVALDVLGQSIIDNNGLSNVALKVYGNGDGGFITRGIIEWYNKNSGKKMGEFSDDGSGTYAVFALGGNNGSSGRMFEMDGYDRDLGGDQRTGSFIGEVDQGGNGYAMNITTRNSGGGFNYAAYFSGSGNVGIHGVTNPAYNLDVSGTGRFTGDLIANNLSGTNTGDQNLSSYATTASLAWQDGGTNIYETTTTDRVGIGTTTPNSTTSLEIVKQSSNQLLKLSSAATGNGDYLVVISGGNTGIGSINPEQKLVVNGTVKATAFSGDGSALTGITSGGGWTDGGTNVYTSTTTDTVGIGTTTPSAPASLEIVKQSSNSPFYISSAANSHGDFMSVQSDGNVGIGTVAPITKMELQKSDTTLYSPTNLATARLAITNTNTTVNNFSEVNYVTATSTGVITTAVGTDGIVTDHTNGSVDADFVVKVKSNNTLVESIRAKSDGAGAVNVGIGTSSPSGLLEVGSRKFNVLSGGNVGIGTILPGALTDNFGNLRISNGGFLISNQATAPTVASNDCGTTVQGTIASSSSDLLGTITVGTLAVTSCSMTFNKTHGTAPICFCQDDSNVLAVRCTTTTTKLTVASTTSMSSDVVAYWCPTNLP